MYFAGGNSWATLGLRLMSEGFIGMSSEEIIFVGHIVSHGQPSRE
jgi:hypothetical protein